MSKRESSQIRRVTKKKHITIVISLLLCAVLVVSGCAKPPIESLSYADIAKLDEGTVYEGLPPVEVYLKEYCIDDEWIGYLAEDVREFSKMEPDEFDTCYDDPDFIKSIGMKWHDPIETPEDALEAFRNYLSWEGSFISNYGTYGYGDEMLGKLNRCFLTIL